RSAPRTRRRRSSKLQAPNPKEGPSTKLQERLRTTIWDLKSGASLELGAWDLELPAPLRSSGRARFIEIEFHFRRFLGAGLRSKEGPRFEAKHFVQHIRRKLLQRRVVLLHGRVKIISLDRNAVLGAFQLDLKAAESFGRPELGIILAHNKKPRQ